MHNTLQTLRRIVQQVSLASHFGEALDLLVREVRQALATEACTIFLKDPQQKEYILVATDGLNPQAVKRIRLRMDEGLVGFVGARGEPINLEDAATHPHFYYHPEAGEERYRAFLGVPIISHRSVLGVLTIQQQASRRFDEMEEAFLVTLSAQLAGVIAEAKTSGALADFCERDEPLTKRTAIYGIPAVPGIGIGTAVVFYPAADLEAVPDRLIGAEAVEGEVAAAIAALEAVRAEITTLCQRLAGKLPAEELALFDVYLKILDHTNFEKEIVTEIRTYQRWAQAALRQVIHRHVRAFENMENAYLSERAADIRDLGIRILSQLQANRPAVVDYPAQTILMGEEITAAALAEVPTDRLVGIVSARGSNNSHVAILARAMGVPTVMGTSALNLPQFDGKPVVVDGHFGQVHLTPPPELLRRFEALSAESRELNESLQILRDLPAETPDGYRMHLYINAGLAVDAGVSLSAGAEGIGLYRTEVPFMRRDCFPAEEEQRVIYRQLLKAFAPRPVVMRTLDIGGDKSLPYFPIQEDNPFLGWRGIRITLDHPDIFLMQIRAMLRASATLNNLRIMLPMISTVAEIDEALLLIQQAYREVIEEGEAVEMPPIGAMIEVPSAVYQIREVAKRVDFLSVGSNDLTQYLLAVDRNNARVANLYQMFHPAVLKALMQIVEGAHREGKPVSICGELASDPVGGLLLLGMGFDSLSMNSNSLLRMKCVIRKFTYEEAKKIVKNALTMETSPRIQHYVEEALIKAGLKKLLRAASR